MTDQGLELRVDGPGIRVVFARRGEQLVVIADDGRMGPLKEAYPGRLQSNESLVRLLRNVEPTTTVWSISTRDMTQVPIQVPSRGYTLAVGDPGLRWDFRFLFADSADASRAIAAAGPFLSEAEAFMGTSLHPQLHHDGDTLAVSVDLTQFLAMAAGDPEKMPALQKKIEQLAADRQLPGD